MAGISSVLNIAKEALLTHQTAISVASHNIANVDTEGYTRQTLTLTTAPSSPIGVGNLGGGVKGESIERQYDQFITKQVQKQGTTLGSLSAQQETYQVLETVFNEADGLAVNDLLNEFWDSWQELANNPETAGTREDVVQNGLLLIDKLQNMNTEISQLRSDLNVNLDSAINDVNTITEQIADLNVQISSTETPTAQQNDLRDKRDELVSQLSELVDISYFESANGSYSIHLADGHSLVQDNESWDLSWSDGTIYWQSENANGAQTKTAVKNGSDLGGKIGGWSEVLNQIKEGDNDNYLGQLNSFTNSLIREVNQVYAQGVGSSPFSEALSSVQVEDTALLLTNLNASQASTSIAAGTISINGKEIGKIQGGASDSGLATTKAANTVAAINAADAGVTAKLTTQTSGDAVSSGLLAGENVAFTVNGVAVSYTAAADETADETATNVVAAIKATLAAYNSDPTTTPKVTITAEVGDGSNGGDVSAIILKNTNSGDESQIILAGLDPTNAAESKLGLSDGSFAADAEHNTGEVALFSTDPITIEAGSDDSILTQLGLGGGNISADDVADDGKLTFTVADHAVSGSLMGLDYADQLNTDGGNFSIWLYDADGDPALTYAVTVDLTRATTLQDVADAINTTLANETGASPAWLTASVKDNQLVLTPDAEHQFAFADDSTNFLAASELNSFFTGSDLGSMGINQTIQDNSDYLAAGRVGDNGEINSGDNSNALSLVAVRDNEGVFFADGSTSTLDDYYNSLVGRVGRESSSVNDSMEYNTMLSDQLKNYRDSASGVSLDEELANLIKYQQAYSAAAKLITVADEMMQTLLETI